MTQTQFIDIFIKGVENAFTEVVRRKGGAGVDAKKASDALKAETLVAYDECLADCKAALEANMGDAIYTSIISAACMEVAIKGYNAGVAK